MSPPRLIFPFFGVQFFHCILFLELFVLRVSEVDEKVHEIFISFFNKAFVLRKRNFFALVRNSINWLKRKRTFSFYAASAFKTFSVSLIHLHATGSWERSGLDFQEKPNGENLQRAFEMVLIIDYSKECSVNDVLLNALPFPLPAMNIWYSCDGIVHGGVQVNFSLLRFGTIQGLSYPITL